MLRTPWKNEPCRLEIGDTAGWKPALRAEGLSAAIGSKRHQTAPNGRNFLDRKFENEDNYASAWEPLPALGDAVRDGRLVMVRQQNIETAKDLAMRVFINNPIVGVYTPHPSPLPIKGRGDLPRAGCGCLEKALIVALLAVIFGFANGASAEAVRFTNDFAALEGFVKPVEQPWRRELCLNGSWQFQPALVPADWDRDQGTPPEMPPPTGSWDSTPIKIPSPWNANVYGLGRNVGVGSPNPYWPDSVWFPSYPASWDGVEMGWLRR